MARLVGWQEPVARPSPSASGHRGLAIERRRARGAVLAPHLLRSLPPASPRRAPFTERLWSPGPGRRAPSPDRGGRRDEVAGRRGGDGLVEDAGDGRRGEEERDRDGGDREEWGGERDARGLGKMGARGIGGDGARVWIGGCLGFHFHRALARSSAANGHS